MDAEAKYRILRSRPLAGPSTSRSNAADTTNVEWPPTKRKMEESVPPGAMNFISSKFESLDFEKCENYLTLDEDLANGLPFVSRQNVSRWFIFLLIGMTTAIIGALIDISVEEISSLKFSTLKKYVDPCIEDDCLYIPYLLWIAMNASFILVGSVLVTYIEPVAAGSGIPQIKCYLNGVKVPRVVRIKTLFVKVIGVITSVVGGLACGKEGPMIHSGAVVGAGISQGKSTTMNKDLKMFHSFREDCEKRDFVSGGAAAGVAAAFGAPVGGVLFSVEEGNSFWHQSLTWKLFFCSLVSTFTLNLILSTYHGHPGDLTFAGLLNFGKFDDLNYQIVELPIFMLMGALGGLLGALFNQINFYITVFRIRYINGRFLKVFEAVFVSAATATVGILMMYLMDDCRPLGQDPTKIPVQMYCGDGYYNALAALWFQTPEASVRSLFHDPLGSHKWSSVFAFFIFYFLLSCWTYGLCVSGGIFIPALLTGAAWGRLCGMGISSLFPNYAWADPGKYAVIGAAANLGGIVRMTLCLTVILIEATGNITFGLPLMIALITAKWTGDYFNEGIYDIHTQLQGVPILAWEPPPLSSNVYATEVMSYPVTSLKTVESVRRIVNVLREESHNGFPVVDPESANDEAEENQSRKIQRVRPDGRLRGLILRHQLVTILKYRFFDETFDAWCNKEAAYRMFRDAYPRYDTIDQVQLSEEEMERRIDLRPFINQSPYTVQHGASLPRIFRLFRGLGLRHLPVVNDRYEVIGMVTRKDLARYRVAHGPPSRKGFEELMIAQKLPTEHIADVVDPSLLFENIEIIPPEVFVEEKLSDVSMSEIMNEVATEVTENVLNVLPELSENQPFNNTSMDTATALISNTQESNTKTVDETNGINGTLSDENGIPDNKEERVTETANIDQCGNVDFETALNGDDRQFLVLDEVGDSDPDDGEFDSDLDFSDIDEMLDEGLQAAKRAKLDSDAADKPNEESKADEGYSIRRKQILVDKSINHFEVLPDGWIVITHNCGMPIYLHRKTRVCTLSKPYFLGRDSVRNHRVPLSAVPCLDYRRALKEESENASEMVIDGETFVKPRVVTSKENEEMNQVSSEELREYCDKLFKFKEIEVMRFSSWEARRNYTKKAKRNHRGSLPDGSKLITCPIKDPSSLKRKEWIMNPRGRTSICIMHDYIQRVLKKKPKYVYSEVDSTSTPYKVTISIGDMEYGSGLGNSKKQAKMEAAMSTLDILIPGIRDKIEGDAKSGVKTKDDLTFFDQIAIEDPRVVEFCNKTTEPLPHAILLTCLQRNFGMNELNIKCQMMTGVRSGKNNFTMTVGKHEVAVSCHNKREGKQKASQAILQILHPAITSWGSLLRLYGNASVKTFNEKKAEEQEITSLQSKGNVHGPNIAILNKLKSEMLLLRKTKETVNAIGIFNPPEDIKMPTTSTSDLCNVQL